MYTTTSDNTFRARYMRECYSELAEIRRIQWEEEEARAEHAAFLAREEAEGFALDAMNDEDQEFYLSLDEAAQHALLADRCRELGRIAA